jgi:hypothetical protein
MTIWTINEVAAACGLSRHEISKWISRGLFLPSMSTRKGAWRYYDWRDVVCLAVIAQLRRIPIDTATALRCAGDELRRGLAGYETLPPAPMHWLVREVGHERRMSFEPADAVAASLAESRTALAVDVARVGWAALNRLGAASEAPCRVKHSRAMSLFQVQAPQSLDAGSGCISRPS